MFAINLLGANGQIHSFQVPAPVLTQVFQTLMERDDCTIIQPLQIEEPTSQAKIRANALTARDRSVAKPKPEPKPETKRPWNGKYNLPAKPEPKPETKPTGDFASSLQDLLKTL